MGFSRVARGGCGGARHRVFSGVADALAADGEALADRRARAGVGVLVCGCAEAADGVRHDGPAKSYFPANVRMIMGGRTFQSGLASSTTS